MKKKAPHSRDYVAKKIEGCHCSHTPQALAVPPVCLFFMVQKNLLSVCKAGGIRISTGQGKQKRLIDEPHKRKTIWFRLLLIVIENYTPSDESFRDMIPATQKDHSYHGYGLKSIRYITEQYGGKMNIVQQDHYFNLTILFPL